MHSALDELTIHFLARHFPTTAIGLTPGLDAYPQNAGHICAECVSLGRGYSGAGNKTWFTYMPYRVLGTSAGLRVTHSVQGDKGPFCLPCKRKFTFLTQEELCTALTA